MASPFDFVKAIGERRDDPVSTGELVIDEYNSFIVNRSLSFRRDSIDFVQLVNENHNISKKGQYLILKALVNKRKPRSGEFWVKQKAEKDLEVIMSYTGLSRDKSEEIRQLCSPEDLERMSSAMEDLKSEKVKKK